MFTVVPSKRWVAVAVVVVVVVTGVEQPGVVPQPQGGHHHVGEDRAAAVRGQEVRSLPLTDEEDGEKVTWTLCSAVQTTILQTVGPTQVPVSPHQEEVCEQSGEQAEEVHRYVLITIIIFVMIMIIIVIIHRLYDQPASYGEALLRLQVRAGRREGILPCYAFSRIT